MKLKRGMVAAPQPIAVEEGVKVLKAGGSAFDAAVAAAFVQGVVDPQMCGIGGWGTATLYNAASGEVSVVDFQGRAGSGHSAGMWSDLLESTPYTAFGHVLKGRVNEVGYQAIGVPGTVAGLRTIWERAGSMPWADLLAPAISTATRGFPVYQYLYDKWAGNEGTLGAIPYAERLKHTSAARAIYTRDGELYKVGETLRQEDMARVLSAIAGGGADVFYRGWIAERMAEDLQANGGCIRLEDLRSYQAKVMEPVHGTYRGYDVYSSPLPGGGVGLVTMLNVLEGFELGDLVHNSSDYLHLLVEAIKFAWLDRHDQYGDPAFVDVPVDQLISKAHAQEAIEAIKAGVPVDGAGRNTSPGTTCLVVVDRDGNVAVITHTLTSASGVVTPGLGFMYNNVMMNFDVLPGKPNSIAPGKARVSGIVSTIVTGGDGQPRLAVAAPGGSRITPAVLQVILNVIDFGRSVTEATVLPRIDFQGQIVDVQGRIPAFVCDALAAKGHRVERKQAWESLARPHGIQVRDDGWVIGGTDPVCDGAALGDDVF